MYVLKMCVTEMVPVVLMVSVVSIVDVDVDTGVDGVDTDTNGVDGVDTVSVSVSLVSVVSKHVILYARMLALMKALAVGVTSACIQSLSCKKQWCGRVSLVSMVSTPTPMVTSSEPFS